MTDQGVDRRELIAYLDRLLDSANFSDYGPNGLQVPGRNRIRKLTTGVSACLELFDRSTEIGAHAVLVHHGLFWEGLPLEISALQHARLAVLLRHEINLIGYHLPLDAHPEFGNNALGARGLGCSRLEPFAELEGRKIGFHGRLTESIDPDQLLERCKSVFGFDPLAFLSGPDAIETIGIVSGGGSKALYEAIELGLDVFITGEPNEWVMNVAREAKIHFVAAGHYRTEVLGVRTLGEHLAARFGLEVEFIDVPNPI